MGAVRDYLKSPASPYVAGAAFGLLSALSGVVAKQMLGASASFISTAGLILQGVAPSLADNMYFKFVMPPSVSWQMLLMVGVIAGAFVAARLMNDFKFRWIPGPDPQWKTVFGPSRLKRALIVFFSGMIVEFGARLAGGCTSGLAVSGAIQLSPAAFIFMAAMFMSGIPTAMLLYRSKY
jgi:uncharacterized protein